MVGLGVLASVLNLVEYQVLILLTALFAGEDDQSVCSRQHSHTPSPPALVCWFNPYNR